MRVDGWSRRSIWGRDGGRFFLTLWRDETPPFADPDIWIGAASRHPLRTVGCVAFALVSHAGIDPLSASAGLQILAPQPDRDLGPLIAEMAHTASEAVRRVPAPLDDFALGQWGTYRWVRGQDAQSPTTGVNYACAVPGLREISAEYNATVGVLNQIGAHPERRSFEGTASALGWIVDHVAG